MRHTSPELKFWALFIGKIYRFYITLELQLPIEAYFKEGVIFYAYHLIMPKYLVLAAYFFLIPFTSDAKPDFLPTDSTETAYLAELKIVGKAFLGEFRPRYITIYSEQEQAFLRLIDSSRYAFFEVLNKYRNKLETGFIKEQELEINYYFDKFIAEYPYNYEIYSGKALPGSSKIIKRLDKNLDDFNKPDYLQKSDFTDYARSFFSLLVNRELKTKQYQNTDNRVLQVVWHLLPKYITNTTCLNFWMYDYLYYHIDNVGIKNIEGIYSDFKANCTDTAYLRKVTDLYSEDSIGRQDHLIKTYKQVGPFQLDLHIFLPDSSTNDKKRPVIVYFYGGSWSEGKPDWFFYSCQNYAKKGWIACAVEYRIYSRQGTLPFEAVKDGRSAIRWLRQHADEYNLDTNRIVASGNSAGGHLALDCAMADKWNEATDDLRYSPVPNLLMINSGVYDLTDQNTAWIRKDLKNKDLAKTISPNYLVRKGLPPMLIIHGTSDGNVPYNTAKVFAEEMTDAGNPIEFHSLTDATHFIWLDPRFSTTVSNIRIAFLKKWGYL
jgi:acetyl esterase/lipase